MKSETVLTNDNYFLKIDCLTNENQNHTFTETVLPNDLIINYFLIDLSDTVLTILFYH